MKNEIGWLETNIIIKNIKHYDKIMKRYDKLTETLNDQGHVVPDEHDSERTNLMHAMMNYNYNVATTNMNGKDAKFYIRRAKEQKKK